MEAQAQRPLVQLPCGIAINMDKVLFIARKELNQYMIFMENCQASPNITGADLDVMVEYGLVQRLESTAVPPKLEVAS
jgi:hypothetical protein